MGQGKPIMKTLEQSADICIWEWLIGILKSRPQKGARKSFKVFLKHIVRITVAPKDVHVLTREICE